MSKMVKKLMKNKILWEIMGYVTLALCVGGQIIVGYAYIFAQIIYLLANIIGCVRDFVLDLPTANKVKDATFTAITLGLIIIRFMR